MGEIDSDETEWMIERALAPYHLNINACAKG